MTSVGVIAHRDKTLGGGLTELRRLLADRGFTDPIWYEVPKSRKAPEMARKALEDGADLLLLWGGDGTVQRCIDVLAGSGVTLAVMPAGTANMALPSSFGPEYLTYLLWAISPDGRPVNLGELTLNGYGMAAAFAAGSRE